jgi:hypothetical protein
VQTIVAEMMGAENATSTGETGSRTTKVMERISTSERKENS